MRAVGVRTDESGSQLLWELEDGVGGKMDSFLFTNKESRRIKYINDVIDHTVETEIYMQFKKRCVRSVKMAKSENVSKIVYPYIYISISHTCRRSSITCCW